MRTRLFALLFALSNPHNPAHDHQNSPNRMSPKEFSDNISDDEGENTKRGVISDASIPSPGLDHEVVSEDEDGEDARVKCCIVGAGAAGLQCAHSLITEYGYEPRDVLIVEARNRIGGRIHTTTETRTNVEGDPVQFNLDHGAAWVHGTGFGWGEALFDSRAVPVPNPMMKLLQQETTAEECIYEKHLKPIFHGNPWMRPRTVVHGSSEMVLYVGGQRLDKDSSIILKALTRHFMILQEVSSMGDALYERGMGMDTVEQSLEETIKSVLEQTKLRKQLQELSDDDRALIEALTPFYLHLVECYYGSPASELQLCVFTEDQSDEKKTEDEAYTEEGDFYGPHCTLHHGMETVLQPLLRDGVRDRIRLEEQVTKICNQENVVVLETATGRRVHADCCVVTMPAGVLKEAMDSQRFFEPELSLNKSEAVHVIKMGGYKKIFLTFDHIFWPIDEAFLGMVRKTTGDESKEDPLGNYLLFDNLWARDGVPCIEAVLFGSAADSFAGKDVTVIRDAVLDFMQEAMGLDVDLADVCRDCHVTRWEEDPFSRGAYSHLTLGALERHVEELCRPEWDGRLVVSGEGTIAEFEGSVHGALFSGKNASQQIHSYITSLSRKQTPRTKVELVYDSPSTVTDIASPV